MSNLTPIVYSRTKYADYGYLAKPAPFQKSDQWKLLSRHVRMVMAVEFGRGPMKSRRWHVMAIDGLVVVGIATHEFGRTDFDSRPIRGYYGFVMSPESAFLPDIRHFRLLDESIVAPVHEKHGQLSDSWLSDCLTGSSDGIGPLHVNGSSASVVFNEDKTQVKFFAETAAPEKILNDAIRKAVACARRASQFEFVWGLANHDHAKEVPFMNVVCLGDKSERTELATERDRKEGLGPLSDPPPVEERIHGKISPARQKKNICRLEPLRKLVAGITHLLFSAAFSKDKFQRAVKCGKDTAFEPDNGHSPNDQTAGSFGFSWGMKAEEPDESRSACEGKRDAAPVSTLKIKRFG